MSKYLILLALEHEAPSISVHVANTEMNVKSMRNMLPSSATVSLS